MTGTVKFFDDKRGFGFITYKTEDGSDKDIFVHYTGIEMKGHRTLKDGATVTFEISNDDENGKVRAVNVKASE